MIRRLVFTFLACAALSGAAPAPSPVLSQPEVEADTIEGDFSTGTGILRGHARFRDQGVLLVADQIRYEAATGTVIAEGNVVLTRGVTRLLAERLSYHRIDGSFEAEDIRLGSHPYFVEGRTARGNRAEITVQDARASYGEPGPWQPTINADAVTFTQDQRLRSENVTIGIGHAQPVPIPRFEQNLNAPLIGTVSLDGGFRRSLGAFVDAAMHIPLAPSIAVGPSVGLYTNRGVMVGPSGRYARFQHPEQLRGHFRSGYINDHGDKDVDLLGRPVPEDRAYLEWQHEQLLAPNLTLAAQLNWWKDSEVVRDFRPRTFFPVQEPDSFAEAVYQGGNYIISAFVRAQPNNFHVVPERLPEIRFDLLPSALGRGFYQRFNASAARLAEDPLPVGPFHPGPRGPELRSTRLDGYYALERPFAPRDWLAFTPMAGGRLTHYANTRGAARAGNYTRILGEAGFDAALRSSGTFDYRNPQWKIDGLRHLLTPRLTYRYIPESDRGRGRIPRIDRQAFSTYLQPLGLGDDRRVDELRATNTLRLGIDNILQTRDPVLQARDLIAFNVAADFRFKRSPAERDVSEIHSMLSLTPAPWIALDIYESFAPQARQQREFNSALTIRDGRAWEVRFTSNFLRRQIEDYAIDSRVRINEVFEALTRLHYDARRNRFNEQQYGIAHNLGNTWLVSYTVSLYSGRRRESNFGVNVRVDTVRF